MRKKYVFIGIGIVVAVFLFMFLISKINQSAEKLNNSLIDKDGNEIKYLMFQIFTGSPSPEIAYVNGKPLHPPLSKAESKAEVEKIINSIIGTIATKGTKNRKLGFIVGPLSFDNTDDQIKNMIGDSFSLSLEKDVAVGFHIDESMMWARRNDLWQDKNNVEWVDWDGTPSTGLLIDWGSPVKLEPRMCFNSKNIQSEVQGRANLIGREIKKGIDKLKEQGKENLFAGVIVGWETHMGQDYDDHDKMIGFCALVNRGFSKNNQPKDMGNEIASIVQEFINLWAKGVYDAGIPEDKIYSHTAFIPRKTFEIIKQNNHALSNVPYSFALNFGSSSVDPEASFGKYHRPGFSTYPLSGTFEQIYDEISKHDNIYWASSEGTNIIPGQGTDSSGMSMETYLAMMYNHGATLVNVYSFGLGGDELKNKNPFRIVTESKEAIAAYKKFLNAQ